jgi:NhaP-type Na+/H+ or K+/H+ antiporter
MYPRVVLIYPIVLFSRGLAIFVAFPLLKRMGTGATWQDAVIMWWGGLRGSVGLALALVIQVIQPYPYP